MPIDSALGSLSDQLLTVAVLCYTIAMLGHAVEYAFGARGAAGQAVRRDRRVNQLAHQEGELVTIGAAESRAADGGPDEPGADAVRKDGWTTHDGEIAGDVAADAAAPPTVSPTHAALAGTIAFGLTVLGALAQIGCLAARGLAAGRVPWGNMYEFVIAVCLVGVVSWIVVAFRRPVRHLGVFVTLAMVLLLGFAAVRLYTEAGPLVPALNSYWLKIHVTAAILATGVFLIGFVAAALYLLRNRYDTVMVHGGPLRFPITLGQQLPAAETLERVSFRLHTLAFPIWTFAIIAGAIWAEEAWTRYWGWDPKEVWAFISWVVYAAYLHARATAGWRRSTAAWIAVIGWLTMLINLFVVNLVIEGLHSYSGT